MTVADASRVVVEPKQVTINYGFSLTPEQADALYNDLTIAFRRLGVDTVPSRNRLDVEALYALYDGLWEAGIAGNGSHHA